MSTDWDYVHGLSLLACWLLLIVAAWALLLGLVLAAIRLEGLL